MDKTLSSRAASTQQETFSAADYHQSKVVAERILGSLLLVIAAPFIGLIVALVRFTSSGRAMYKQTRVGKEGQEFSMYKIRTMYEDAEASGKPQWSMPGDDRITPVGRVLRFLHLDELPQLANVALGHMSLVGPRPERPEFVTELARSVPNYMDRLAVLPGVTGLAQVNLPPDNSLESVRQKVVLDREYIQTATFTLDIRIFCCTLLRMTGLHHGVAPWLFAVERKPNAILSVNTCSDTVELAGFLDDTVIDTPSLIANPLASKTTAKRVAARDATLDLDQVACAVEAISPRSQSLRTSKTRVGETASPAPRHPR